MAKIHKKQKPISSNCLKLVQAIISEDAIKAKEALKKIVKTNIARKIHKAEKETDLF